MKLLYHDMNLKNICVYPQYKSARIHSKVGDF